MAMQIKAKGILTFSLLTDHLRHYPDPFKQRFQGDTDIFNVSNTITQISHLLIGASFTKKGAYGRTYLTCYRLSLAIRTIRKSTIQITEQTITEPISDYLYLSLPISTYLYLSLTISGYLWLSLTISVYLRQYQNISGHPKLSPAISSYLQLSPAISSYLQLPLAISS